jgi:hypothetical protein
VSQRRLAQLRASLPFTGGQAKIVLRQMIAELEAELSVRTRATEPPPAAGGGELFTELKALGAEVDELANGLWIVDGRRMSTIGAEDYRDKLKRLRRREAA